MRVLVVNVGSSTIKLEVIDGGSHEVASFSIDAGANLADAVAEVTRKQRPDAVGHRIVHGGVAFRRATLLDDGVIAMLEELVSLAPLHQGQGLDAVAALRGIFPDISQVACFDTAFFTDLPQAASTYAVPARWSERFNLRRFGFHGLSHSYASRRAASLLNLGDDARVITCHLGSGASLAAVRDGRAVDTTMGFTPLEGLVMATRSGSIDPGMLLWLQTEQGIEAAEMSDVLEHGSGLLGLTGTADMREVVAAAEAGEDRAALALEIYVHRLRAGIASMAAAMDGFHALVFTGGVGEHASIVRARACAGLSHLGVQIDEAVNASAEGDTRLEVADSAAAVLVVAAREELEIASQVERLLSYTPPSETDAPAQNTRAATDSLAPPRDSV